MKLARLLRFRIHTLMLAVCAVGLLIWAGMMGMRSYDYYQRAKLYRYQEIAWREVAAARAQWAEFGGRCSAYFAKLAQKYREAMWRPWMHVEPDPFAPGVEEALAELRSRSS